MDKNQYTIGDLKKAIDLWDQRSIIIFQAEDKGYHGLYLELNMNNGFCFFCLEEFGLKVFTGTFIAHVYSINESYYVCKAAFQVDSRQEKEASLILRSKLIKDIILKLEPLS